jgi:tRNA A-37 threonylcarbamoyl transferase component Bud32
VSVHKNIQIGAEFLGYRVEALIGQGGMGVVYRAYDLRLKRRVALKLMAPELALDERFRERFSRESELAMSLEHPNVVPIHDAGESDGRLYLAMREVEGTDLKALLREEGRLDPARAVAISTQVAAALDAAHARRLVHRDVKPSNVLLDPSEHVYLADFGLTRRLADQDVQPSDARSLGTPAYLAPEQIEGGPIDGRADVYSLACLLYECLTGEAPFPAGPRLAVAWAHLEEKPPSASERNSDLPAAIDAVIQKGMAKDPDDRYPTCAELLAAAKAALGLGHTAVARRRTFLMVAATVVLTLASVLAAVFLTRGDPAAAGSNRDVRANSLVRIDPSTNAISAVIGLDEEPFATAVAGRSVWVYSRDGMVSEIDPAANAVRFTTRTGSVPTDADMLSGPVLAADPRGAWLVGYEPISGRYVLTRFFSGRRGKLVYRLTGPPKGVAVGAGAVWVLSQAAPRNSVLRIDPATGAVTQTTPLPTSGATSIGVGGGRVWVASSYDADFYRIDPRSARVTGRRDLGDCAGVPVAGFGSVWMCVCNPGSSMLRIDPRTLGDTAARNSIPAQNGYFAVGHGSLWWHDIPSGTVMRWAPATGRLLATVRVTPTPPGPEGGLATTAIAAGAGGVWVTVAG